MRINSGDGRNCPGAAAVPAYVCRFEFESGHSFLGFTMSGLPELFADKMKRLMGDEWDDFLQGLGCPRVRGLRVNTAKAEASAICGELPFSLVPVSWTDNGFSFLEQDGEVRPAGHPYYAAGLYYLQEPSAMAPASRLPIAAGDKVLDLCAAPGGKATELAVRLAVADATQDSRLRGAGIAGTGQRGFLIANEVVATRVKALLHNLEQTGMRNYCVLNESPDRLTAFFPEFFDKILVDAPCSGEGMFRKEEAARALWSQNRVEDCARTQEQILEEAYRMLKPGGMLLYSTCTFSPEENEQRIASLTESHPDMRLCRIPPATGFSPGREDWVPGGNAELQRCVRIWPHRARGEGHFMALLQKGNPDAFVPCRMSGDGNVEVNGRRTKGRKHSSDRAMPGKEEKQLLRDFFCDILCDTDTADRIAENARVWTTQAYLPAVSPEKLKGLHVLRNGLYLGDWKKKRFEPSHSLALYLEKDACRHSIRLAPGDPRLEEFLRGGDTVLQGEDLHETVIPDRSVGKTENSWILVCVGEYPVGWGKIIGNKLKNKIPPGWRKQY